MPPLRWNENDRHNVAKTLVQKYRRLGIDRLVSAIRECQCKAIPLSGWDALAESTEECLHNDTVVTGQVTRTEQFAGVGV